MMFWKDPPRLSDEGTETPSFLRRSLVKAREKKDSNAQIERISERLSPVMQSRLPISIAAESSLRPGSTGISTVTKTISALFGVGIVSAALFFAVREHQPPTSIPSQKKPPSILVPVKPSVAVANSGQRDDKQEARETERPQPVDDAREPKLKPRYRLKNGATEVEQITAPNPADELTLLKTAQQALDRRPRNALDLTEQHKRLFPDGIFSQEREMLAIEALSKLGQKDEARQRGQWFLERYPHSTHARRINNLLEKDK
jgi:hypothetical protein